MGTHSEPMSREGPTSNGMPSCVVGVWIRRASHSPPQPTPRTPAAWTTNSPSAGHRSSGRFQSSQTATGSISGRGTSSVSARKPRAASRLPRSANTANNRTPTIRFPVAKSNQNGQLTRVRSIRRRSGIASAAATWRMRQSIGPIQLIGTKIQAATGDHRYVSLATAKPYGSMPWLMRSAAVTNRFQSTGVG